MLVGRSMLSVVMGWLVLLVVAGIVIREVVAFLVPLVPYMVAAVVVVALFALSLLIYRVVRGSVGR